MRDLKGGNLGVVARHGGTTAEEACTNDQAQSNGLGYLFFCRIFPSSVGVCTICFLCIRLVRLYPEEWCSIFSIVMLTVKVCLICLADM
jgi:hypothetical protein